MNAGTNLNTSALALETGGNLATIAGPVNYSGTNWDDFAAITDMLWRTNNGPWQAEATSSPWSIPINTQIIANGLIVLEIISLFN